MMCCGHWMVVYQTNNIRKDPDAVSIGSLTGAASIEASSKLAHSLSIIPEAFVEKPGFQCGLCTPCVILSTKNLLETKPKSSPSEIAMSISGHICRCGAYPEIIKSVQKAVEKLENNNGEKQFK